MQPSVAPLSTTSVMTFAGVERQASLLQELVFHMISRGGTVSSIRRYGRQSFAHFYFNGDRSERVTLFLDASVVVVGRRLLQGAQSISAPIACLLFSRRDILLPLGIYLLLAVRAVAGDVACSIAVK